MDSEATQNARDEQDRANDLHLVSYTLLVQSLTIQAPPPGVPLPLPIPVELPPGIARRILGPNSVQEPQLLLEDVSLECKPGEVLAIIGASGSGKSTLLNAIGRRTGGLKTLAGSVTIHPTSATRIKVADAIGFVPQDDLLLSCLTVRETLRFAAGGNNEAVERTIGELGLQKAADTLVGGGSSGKKGISGGERRRLSIGCVLVRQPSVLILDEPTTGLDTTAAFSVLSLLSSLARRNRTVIMSIHQPRSDAYPLFDRLCLLSHGRVVYSGLRRDVLAWFADLGYTCPPQTNPLDFLIDVSAVDSRDEDAERASQARVDRLKSAWAEREKMNEEGDKGETKGAGEDVNVGADKGRKSNRPGFVKQVVVLTNRAMKNVYRDNGLLLGFLLQVAVIGVMAGLTFFNPPETPAGIQTLKTVYYQGVVMFFYLSFILYIYIDCGQLVVFDREREDRLYDVLPWVCSHLLAFLPINIIAPTLYAIILYFMCGFRHDNLARNLFIFIGNCILQQHGSFAYALLAASIDRNFAQASLIANGLSIAMFLSAGYLIVNLPAYIGWMKWLSPYFYGFRWTAITQFRGRVFSCSGIEGVQRNQCIGDNVLVGLRFNLNTPLWVYPLGIVGFILVVLGMAIALLQFYHPGGVKHAKNKLSSSERPKKPAKVEEVEAPTRERVDVELKDMGIIVKGGLLLGTASKSILDGVDVTFRPGRLTVVLGPSGAGKACASLLEAMAGQLPPSRFSVAGSILFNGRPTSSGHSEQVAFVQQSDQWLLPALTIRETLHYAAELQLRGMSKAAKRERAEDVMRAMGLTPVADHVVGGETVKGISGGEKRRLALAVQLLADPSVLLADEPTSGLDAFSALSVIDALRALARSGRTVVASVHQPRSEVWTQVDDVVVLAAGGKVVYAGDKNGVVDWVDGVSGVQMPDWWNPADWVVDAVCGEGRDALVQAWQKDHELKKAEEDAPLSDALSTPSGHAVGVPKRSASEYALPVVLSRSWKNLRRQQDVFVARLANPPFLVLIFWMFFLRLGHGPASAQDRIGLLMENSAMPFVGMLASIAIYPAERDAFYREYKNPASRYGAATFIMSYTIQEVPMQFLAAMIYSVIMMAGMGLQIDARRFFEFSFGIFGLVSFGESIGVRWVINGGLSVSLVSCALTVLAQTCGIISVTLPRWLAVISWGSALTYQARVAFINEFSGLVFNCTQEQLASGECLAATGEQLIETFGFKDRNTAKFTALLLVILVIYRLLAYVAVRARVALL
ncbi:P-loop containing nucleoside triphosphate hydrolase protein [Fomitopsis serialis]|uniref:P-loop containing nucleoside triphosphate hydrolase protein n=1 Tax=Fomitopsis serialis TaxID=139415 RepID=UPI0020084AF0|nr:P-loop containing nucleoside triphosphate hydrolase protein [Neoantrodia serialis]KAH9905520.1 P-loop containing nucleoside triphosphate hydrolase protein [Neoantrodia serialis]